MSIPNKMIRSVSVSSIWFSPLRSIASGVRCGPVWYGAVEKSGEVFIQTPEVGCLTTAANNPDVIQT